MHGRAYAGLIANPGGVCRGAAYRLAHLVNGHAQCTHGPDPVPAGVIAGHYPSVDELRARAEHTTAAIPCAGDGTSGPRIEAVYAATSPNDRYSSVLSSLQTYAGDVEATVEESSGGLRQFKWVTSSCQLVIAHVVLSSTGDDSIDNTEQELAAQGYDRSDRKYLIWVDDPTNTYCGIGDVYPNDSAAQSNPNNGYAAEYARIDPQCWGLRSTQLNGSVEAHELMHTLGAVQDSAPHSTKQAHCTDDYDVMCYQDTSGIAPTIVCPDQSSEDLYDCNHDDYFSTTPSGYLSTHWNSANSSWLLNPTLPTRVLSLHFGGAGTGSVTGGGINCSSDCSPPFSDGTVLTLTAKPDANFVFTGWSGPCTGTGVCTLTLDADKSLTANFGAGAPYRPDLLIKTGSGRYIGDDVYNTTGSGQTKSLTGGRGSKKTFALLLEEDGTNADPVKLTSSANSSGFKLKFTQSGRNLSGSNGAINVFPITMSPGGTAVFQLTVTILSTAKRGAVKIVTLTATSSHGPKDVVKAKVTVT